MSNQRKFDDHDDEPVSKSELKREMHALQAVGEKLVSYSEKQLALFPLTEELRRAIAQAKKINSQLARCRQCQYIGKLMRKIDRGSVEKIIERIENKSPDTITERKSVEAWRERLITEGKIALTEFMQDYAQVDSQALRQLITKAKKESELGVEKENQQRLFRLLREVIFHH